MGYNPVLAFFLSIEIMEERRIQLEKEYNAAMEKPRRVYEIFCDYFGEDKVDMQGFRTLDEYIYNDGGRINEIDEPFILVWFPKVTVTNRNGRSVVVQDLYMKVSINTCGSMDGFPTINRATYPLDQFLSDYMFSHTPGINKTNPREFQHICTGEGPICRTIGNLIGEFDETLWELFCSELDDFVHVESLEGGPYRYLENIGIPPNPISVEAVFPYIVRGTLGRSIQYVPSRGEVYQLIADFTRYLLKDGGLPMEFSCGNYSIGMSFNDCMFYLSNKFIKWFNREDNPYRRLYTLHNLIEKGVLKSCLLKDGVLHISEASSGEQTALEYEGDRICTFKGNPVLRHIVTQSTSENLPLLFSTSIVKNIVGSIVKVVNYRYGRKKEGQPESGGQELYL